MGGNLFAPIAEILKPLKLDIIEPLQVTGNHAASDFEKPYGRINLSKT